jgi:predicted nucleic acid-binding protein
LSIYADTSFFTSVYLRDDHTSEALLRMSKRPRIWLTPFHKIEIAHAIAQKVFRRELSPAVADTVHRNISEDCDTGLWRLVDLPPAVFETGTVLARRHVPVLGTRTLDTLHVASAVELKAQYFWTFDDRQKKLAKAAGLKVS